MEITLRLSDELGQQLQQLPNPDKFVSDLLKKAFHPTVLPEKVRPPSRPSKWAQIAQRIEEDPVHLEGYSQQLKEDFRTFRDHFTFSQDTQL
jgi:hypothetical protein